MNSLSYNDNNKAVNLLRDKDLNLLKYKWHKLTFFLLYKLLVSL